MTNVVVVVVVDVAVDYDVESKKSCICQRSYLTLADSRVAFVTLK